MEVDLETQINHVDLKKMPYVSSSKAKMVRPFTRDSARKLVFCCCGIQNL